MEVQMDNQNYSTDTKCGSKCSAKYGLLTIFAAFVIFAGFDYVWHGIFMMPDYQATSNMWRPMADMQKLAPYGFLRNLLLAIVFCGFFCCSCRNSICDNYCRKGLKFGFMIGLITGINSLASYMWLPFPTIEIPLKWFFADVIQYTLAGKAVGWLYSCCKKEECTKSDS
jgi:hypothetical protein